MALVTWALVKWCPMVEWVHTMATIAAEFGPEELVRWLIEHPPLPLSVRCVSPRAQRDKEFIQKEPIAQRLLLLLLEAGLQPRLHVPGHGRVRGVLHRELAKPSNPSRLITLFGGRP